MKQKRAKTFVRKKKKDIVMLSVNPDKDDQSKDTGKFNSLPKNEVKEVDFGDLELGTVVQ